ncbi:MAG: UDP-N-acetylmuramate dehydrogenase [Gammaproteobacteria bacterium]|nr:MAG: UDP-N-acetylmuramate dehydrogenase [Gammaproteobacteria bacterium]
MMAEDLLRPRGELREHESLARYTTWRVGGPADRLYRPADLIDLQQFLARLPADEPLTFIGLGSNLLVRDGGIRGTVIAMQGALNEMKRLDETRIYLQAGVSGGKAARFAAAEGLVGLEFLAGIPGTVGGALAMNAGAFGGETWPLVESVETIDREGVLHRRSPGEFEIGYRHVAGPEDEWFVSATFRLQAGDTEAARQRIRGLLDERNARQPIGKASCGSVFRNPPGDHAARLIESCGLKGECIGGACVSDKHANFIINTGSATAADIEALIRHVQSVVEQERGVRLEPEVRIVGAPA